MARQPGYYSSEDTPDAAFFLECGFRKYAEYERQKSKEFELPLYNGLVIALVGSDSVQVFVEPPHNCPCGSVRIFPKRDDGYVDCQDIVDLLMLLGVPCSVELH